MRSSSLKTGHTLFHVRGSLSLYAAAPIFEMMVKGP